MKHPLLPLCLPLLLSPLAAEPLRVSGSTTVNPIVSEAAERLREERGMVIHVDTQGGSSGGIAALGRGRVEIAMSSKPIARADRETYPEVDFVAHRIGADGVALVVSADVREGGVRALSREQMRAVYEKRARNWGDFGGPDRRIVFFNKEPGRGTWEVFADWLCGDAGEAPPVAHLEVGANEETRAKVAGTRGAMSQLSASWVDGESVRALGIRTPDGEVVRPTEAAIAAGEYPLGRSLWLLTDGPPSGDAKVLIDYVKSETGQELVREHGYLPLDGAGE